MSTRADGRTGSRFPISLMLSCMLLGATATRAVTRTWTGAGANALASNADNWSDTTAPVAGDDVVFDDSHYGNARTNVTWDLDPGAAGFASWTQTADYLGTVTIMTRYPAAGGFTNLHVAGHVTLTGGKWTQTANTVGSESQVHRLAVSIGGDFTLGGDAMIDVDVKGFSAGRGPSPGGTTQGHTGAGHGGVASWGTTFIAPGPTYGSVFRPTTLGSGGNQPGGGAVYLTVEGTATLNGAISARGTGGYRWPGSAGGSILLKADALSGTGWMDASGGTSTDNTGAGGGGRIGVILESGTTFGTVAFRAFGNTGAHFANSAAGTVYLQAAEQDEGEGILILDNNNLTDFNAWHSCTLIPDAGAHNDVHDLSRLSAIIITNRAILGISSNTVFDFGAVPIHGAGASTVADWRTASATPAKAAITLRGTNFVTFPNPFVISNYSLCLDVPVKAVGDWVVATNGSLSHSGNFNPLPGVEDYRLQLELSGNLTVAAGGAIEANTKGYYAHRGPGCWTTATGQGQTGSSHGGTGGQAHADRIPLSGYGSVLAPTTLGSGGGRQSNAYIPRSGGGAIDLFVHGTTTVHGVISARQSVPNQNRCAGAAGGSIHLRTGWLNGGGTLDASGDSSGSDNCGTGGGGRIAVKLLASESFGNVALAAPGMPQGSPTSRSSGAGSVYRETASQHGGRGVVLIDNNATALNSFNVTNVTTELIPGNYATQNELAQATLVITNRAQVALTGNTSIGNLYLATNHADNRLYLNGHTLTVNSYYHSDWGNEAWVVDGGGQIVWKSGTLLMVR